MSAANVKGKKRNQTNGWIETAVIMMRGGGLALAVVLLATVAAAFAVLKGVAGQGVVKTILMFACLFGSFVGSVMCIRRGEGRNFTHALGVGIVAFMMILALGAVLLGGEIDMGRCGLLAAVCVCGGGLGGMTGKRKGAGTRRK